MNLLAVGMDGNNQIIPISIGVSQGESGESWTWFLSKLKDCIGEVPNLVIISDRHYAIILACKTVFPNSFHSYSSHYLMMIYGMQSEKFKVLYWKTCKAYMKEEFDKLLYDIQGVQPDAHQKLVEAEIEKWSRAKYNIYEVTDNKMIHMVYLEKDECTCHKWELYGLPYGHVCAVARAEGLSNVNNLAKPWFLNKTDKATYEGVIYPVKDVPTWQTPKDLQLVLPPVMGNKLPGRLKSKDRIRSQGERPILTKCERCGAMGHNKTACNVPLPSFQCHKGDVSVRLENSDQEVYSQHKGDVSVRLENNPVHVELGVAHGLHLNVDRVRGFQDDTGTRLDLGSYKESLEVEKNVVEQPVNDIKEEDESAEDDYELKRRVKGKHVEDSRHTPLPTTIKSPRIHTTLIYSDTEKHQDLTVIDPTPSSSSPKPSSFLKPSYSLQPKTRRFKQYKSFFEQIKGRYGYLFRHLKTAFMPQKSFHELANYLQAVMQELLPSMVNSQVKKDTKTTNHVYVVEGLILERQKMQVKVSQMFTYAIQRERENI
nr:hypothetical protein [Tanacetum cinerariifolium]